MYRCHVHLYWAGPAGAELEAFQGEAPLEGMTHEFSQSEEPVCRLAARADVIFADVRGKNPEEFLKPLLESKKPDGDLIVLADQEQAPGLPLGGLSDVWFLPMGQEEARFRFARWQQGHKQRMDLWETRQFLDATIDSVPNLVWYKTWDGIHEKVNASFCHTVGKTREQVQGQGHAYIWDVEEDDPACIESEAEVMRTRQTCVSEERIRTGGGERLLTTYKSPLYDYDGSVMGTVGVAIDITQERAYAEELEMKSRTLETLFTSLECGVMVHTLDGSQVLSINPAALEILGYGCREDMMAGGFHMMADSVLDEDKEALRQVITSLKNEGDSASAEYRVRHLDGKVLHVMGNIKLIRENGELVCQRFLLDVTEQKQKEQSERRRQEALIHALSIDYNLVCFFDLETGEGHALRITGCPYGDLDEAFSGPLELSQCMSRYIDNCVFPDDQDMMRETVSQDNLIQELSQRQIFYVNYRTNCKGAEDIRYFQMKVVRLDSESESGRVVLGFRSIDEETKLELEKTNLLKDALMQANRASRAKTVFLSNMSHDIRTPMNAIIGFTALAVSHIESRELVEGYLKKIMTSGNHLLSLINDVLDMSRIESGKLQLEEKPCSLPEILHGLRNIVLADVHAKQLELYMDTVDVVHENIVCDNLRLNQVLLNLLGNSIKYTGPGGMVSMRISEKPGAPEGFARYEFCIRDTGIGMSEEFVARIAEPFERERNSTTSGIQGTGLGMAITKNIVDMMNGTIDIKSKQNVGTEFTVCFTFKLDGDVPESQTIPQLQNCRALVVDDDFNTCDSVTCMLQEIGLRAEWTLSGKEAVLRTRQAVMREDEYSVYIIDWLLPDMNGIEVARRVRKEIGEEVPIIVLTAYDWSDIEDEARSAGVTAFCSKPLFLSELRDCLQSIITEREDGGKAEEKPARRTGHILLAEDNELNQEIAVAILEEAGFTIDVAENGQAAVEKLESSQPGYYRLVLMDVQMPVMNGYEATREIRRLKNKKLSRIPILAMTANAFEEDRQEAIRSGMNGHIPKPINVDTLMEAMDSLLEEEE
ncbi:response regulator [Acutalibacter sp. JLR.KK004]|uniref:PAS domain-containing hybrid sensor histidine kinase/response regulator n=1 Tax=Acutalibacter sp. JLR.KK004 TaxID=3112622 RepID=UPI002FF1D2E4